MTECVLLRIRLLDTRNRTCGEHRTAAQHRFR
jgi:hypothetical protein